MTFSALIPILKHMADNELHENNEDTALTTDIHKKKGENLSIGEVQ